MAQFETDPRNKIPQVGTLTRAHEDAKGVVNANDIGWGTGGDVSVDDNGVMHVRGSPTFRFNIHEWDSTLTYNSGDVVVGSDFVVYWARRQSTDSDPANGAHPNDWAALFGSGGGGEADGVVTSASYDSATQRITITRSVGGDLVIDLTDLDSGAEVSTAIMNALVSVNTQIAGVNTKVDRITFTVSEGTLTLVDGAGTETTFTVEGDPKTLIQQPEASTGALRDPTADDVGRFAQIGGNIRVGYIVSGSEGNVDFRKTMPTLGAGQTWRGVFDHYSDWRNPTGVHPAANGDTVYSKSDHAFFQYRSTGFITAGWDRMNPQPLTVIGNFHDEAAAADAVQHRVADNESITTGVGMIVEYGDELYRVVSFELREDFVYGWGRIGEIRELYSRGTLGAYPYTALQPFRANENGDGVEQFPEPKPGNTLPVVGRLPEVSDTSPLLVYLTHDYTTGDQDDAELTVAVEGNLIGFSNGDYLTPAFGSIDKDSPLDAFIGSGTASDYSLSKIVSRNEDFINSIDQVVFTDGNTENAYQLTDSILDRGFYTRTLITPPENLSGTTVSINFSLNDSAGSYYFNDGSTGSFSEGLYEKRRNKYRSFAIADIFHLPGSSFPDFEPTEAGQWAINEVGWMWVSQRAHQVYTTPPRITRTTFFTSPYYKGDTSYLDLVDDGTFTVESGRFYQRRGSNTREVSNWRDLWVYIIEHVTNGDVEETRNHRDNGVFLGVLDSQAQAAEARNEYPDNEENADNMYYYVDSSIQIVMYRIIGFEYGVGAQTPDHKWSERLITITDLYNLNFEKEHTVKLQHRAGWVDLPNDFEEIGGFARGENIIGNIYQAKGHLKIKSGTFQVQVEGSTAGDSIQVVPRFFRVKKGDNDQEFFRDSITYFGRFSDTEISMEFTTTGGVNQVVDIEAYFQSTEENNVVSDILNVPDDEFFVTVSPNEYFFLGLGWFTSEPLTADIKLNIAGTRPSANPDHEIGSAYLNDSEFSGLLEYVAGGSDGSNENFPIPTTVNVYDADIVRRMSVDFDVESRKNVVFEKNGYTRGLSDGNIILSGGVNVEEKDNGDIELSITGVDPNPEGTTDDVLTRVDVGGDIYDLPLVVPDSDTGALPDPTAVLFDSARGISRVIGWSGNQFFKVGKKLVGHHTASATFTDIADETALTGGRWRGFHWQDYLVSDPQDDDFYYRVHEGLRQATLTTRTNARFNRSANDCASHANERVFAFGGVTSMGDSSFWGDNFSTSKRLKLTFKQGDTVIPAVLQHAGVANELRFVFATSGVNNASTVFNNMVITIGAAEYTFTNPTTIRTSNHQINQASGEQQQVTYEMTGVSSLHSGDTTIQVTTVPSGITVEYDTETVWNAVPNNADLVTDNSIVPHVFVSEEDALGVVGANGQRVFIQTTDWYKFSIISDYLPPDPGHFVYEWEPLLLTQQAVSFRNTRDGSNMQVWAGSQGDIPATPSDDVIYIGT